MYSFYCFRVFYRLLTGFSVLRIVHGRDFDEISGHEATENLEDKSESTFSARLIAAAVFIIGSNLKPLQIKYLIKLEFLKAPSQFSHF